MARSVLPSSPARSLPIYDNVTRSLERVNLGTTQHSTCASASSVVSCAAFRSRRRHRGPSPHVCLCLFYYDDGTESNKFGYIAVVTALRRPRRPRRPTANCFTVPASHKYFITVYPLPLLPPCRSLPLNQADPSLSLDPHSAHVGEGRKEGRKVG